ncbi:hypothetical protein Goklo_017764 [Gossypium klotzschianum]|uniref:UspA domain-containing protein n=2 Tax=Gossypium TaxID=3633 RepID=A0A7J8UIM5_9ROSI|nr:hypothetical protein [Gossypium klotzschianum]
MAADRRVGIAVDFSPSSKNALKWAVDNVIRKGDHLILVAVRPEGHYDEGDQIQLWEATGSRTYSSSSYFLPFVSREKRIQDKLKEMTFLFYYVNVALIPLSEFCDPIIMKRYGVKPDPETLDIVTTAARQTQIEVLMKIYWGDPREKLCEAIDTIPLSCIIVGNRGLGTLKRAIMGSVSNYVVNNASCPVTVVKHHV